MTISILNTCNKHDLHISMKQRSTKVMAAHENTEGLENKISTKIIIFYNQCEN